MTDGHQFAITMSFHIVFPAFSINPHKIVGPGATSGKKTKHEKGMTTGSSRRSGANKSDAANPSGQSNVDPNTESGVGPKSGGKY
jgi:hypothetical protein